MTLVKLTKIYILLWLISPPIWSLFMYHLDGVEPTVSVVLRSYLKEHPILIGALGGYFMWFLMHVVGEYKIQ